MRSIAFFGQNFYTGANVYKAIVGCFEPAPEGLCRFLRLKAGFRVKKSYKLVLAACVLCCFYAQPASACRYNVRETGFVDLGIESYFLYAFVDGNTPAEFTAEFKRAGRSSLAQSNVRVQIVDVNKYKDHPAVKLLDANDLTLPTAMLVSPDGQSMNIVVSKPGEPLKKTLGSAIEKILSSPWRDKILHEVAKMYGTVVLLEGPDAKENKAARKATAAAVKLVASQMDMMPKPIAHPPSMLVIDAKSLAKEEMLLWVLGMEAKDVNEPYAIIVYGRGRWIGPLFRGKEVNEDDLASVLFVVGADCECGLDYRWLQGTMLPAKWGQKLHKRAVDSLGFDPESPMIKMEIASIIGRGMGGYRYQGMPYGYRELIIEPESEDEDEPVEPEEKPGDDAGEPEGAS